MFATSSIQEKGTEFIILIDLSTKTYAEIAPGWGGILHSFNVLQNGSLVNVIDQYEDTDDFRNNVTIKGFKSAKLSPFACRINNASYRFGEKTYTSEKFILNGSALHGLLYDVPFKIKYTYADDEHAGVALEYRYRGEDKGYPFHFDCVVTYHLKKNNELVISTDIFNKDEGLIPVQDGWHPYFTFGGVIDDLQMEFQSKGQVEFDEKMIPTGKMLRYEEFAALEKIGNRKFDDCFVLNFAECQPLFVLRDPGKRIQIEVRPDKSYPYLQLYTPDHRKSIAVENLSAIPDTFNNGIGLVILPPDANKIFTTTFRITLLD